MRRAIAYAPHPPLLAALLASLVALNATPSSGAQDLLPPRGMALGGGLRSLATGALGPLLNPSGMALTHQYDIELSYGFGVQDLGSTLLLSIVDSVTSKLAAGLYYAFIHGSPRFAYLPGGPTDQAVREGHETGLSLAIPIGERFSFGITGKYLTLGTDVANPFFNALDPLSPKRIIVDSTTQSATANGFTMDAGFTLRLGDSFGLGVVGYNLIPLHSVEAPISLGGGLSYQFGQNLLLAADVVVDFDRYHSAHLVDGKTVQGAARATASIGGGLEYVIAGKVPIRAGAIWDNGRPGTWLSLGLGFQSTSFGIDIAYRQRVSGGNDSLLVAGIRVFLQ